MANDRLNILAISGSLREGALNSALLEATKKLAPKTFEIEVRTLGGVPLYNEDLDGADPPAAVVDLRSAVRAADGLMLSTPEYNRSMSAALKNALDWLSRPVFEGVVRGKNAVALVATESTYHGMDAWVDLARLLRHLSVHVIEPDLVVHTAHQLLVLEDDGGVSVNNEFVAASLTLQLQALEKAIHVGVADTIREATDTFAEQLYRPRRSQTIYPLKIQRAHD